MSAPAVVDSALRSVRLGPYSGLAHRFAIELDDPLLGEHLRWAFSTLEAPAQTQPAGWYRITRNDAATPRYSVAWDDELIVDDAHAARALGMLMWHVNQQTIRTGSEQHVLLHAAAVARDGRALVMPAAMESGKTTLAAGLIDRGWAYLTDEAAGVTLDGRSVRGYPKPLSIDPGSSQVVLAEWAPPVADEALEWVRRGQWQVPATARPGGQVIADAELAAIVLPRYEKGAATTLRRLPRAEAVARVAGCSFVWSGGGLAARFAALAAAVRRSACAELITGDLDEACRAIQQLWETRS